MPETRYHELLGLPAGIEDPNYYQLLGIERSVFDAPTIEAHFKEQMTRLQKIENPAHKEFLEFLKGELKRARGVLTDPARRKEYDHQELVERGDDLRKVLSHMLTDKQLSASAESSVQSEGKNLGLEPAMIKVIIDEELQKAGAKRGANKSSDKGTQILLDRRAQEFARESQEARLQARIAQSRAMMAEIREKKAEGEAQAAQKQVRQAQAMARRAITAEQLTAAQKEHGFASLEERAEAAETRARKIADESLRVTQQLERAKEEVAAAVTESKTARARGRVTWSYATLASLFIGVQAAKLFAAEPLAGAAKVLAPLVEAMSAKGAAGAALGGIAAMAVIIHLCAGAKKPVFAIPLLLMAAFAAVASLLL